MRAQQKFSKIIVTVVSLLLLCAAVLVSGWGNLPAFADSSAVDYTVLSDLIKAKGFEISDYPSNAKDNSIQVIQIAESVEGELVVYTYQPSGTAMNLTASSINISRQQNDTAELSFKNYALTLLGSTAVFYKYKVEGFEVSGDPVRYYNISNILRPFNKMIDKAPASGSISEVPNAVGKLYTVRTENGEVQYGETHSEVVEITRKYVGFFDYFDGVDVSVGWDILLGGGVDINGTHTIRNFVAFSTDRDMNRLMEVELQFALQSYKYKQCANPICMNKSHPYKTVYDEQLGNKETQEPVVLTGKEMSNNAHGWFGHTYEWNTIQTTEEFLAGADSGSYTLTTEGVKDITGTQWVLNFHDSIITATGKSSPTDNQITWEGERASDVIILRLLFEEDGTTYNLGAVDSKQTSSGKPINVAKKKGLPQWAVILIIVGVALVVCIVLGIIFPPFGKVLLRLLKGLWWLICAPFRGIAWIVQTVKKRKEEKENKDNGEEQKYKSDEEARAGNKGKSAGKPKNGGKGKDSKAADKGGSKAKSTAKTSAAKRGKK